MQDLYQTRKTLIQRMQETQNERSWEEFLCIYEPYVYTIIRNMNIAEDDAKDVAQQVMVKVWKNIDGIEVETNKRFRSWLGKVTKNCATDFIRKRSLDAKRLDKARRDETLTYLSSIRLPDIEAIAEREWGVHIFNMALERVEKVVSKKAIQVFTLSMQGMDVDQIAEKMDMKKNSVYRSKNRVKERLAQQIDQLRQELE